MPQKQGNHHFTERERYLIKSLIKDLLLFGAREDEIIESVSKKLGQPFAVRNLYIFKKEIAEEEEPAEKWLDNFVQFGLPSYYKKRFDEVEYILRTMMILYSQELAKEKKNPYAITQMARTIVDTSRVLAEYGMAPPIIAKIKSMIPLELSSLNQKIEDTKNNLKSSNTYIKSLDILDHNHATASDSGEKASTQSNSIPSSKSTHDEQQSNSSSHPEQTPGISSPDKNTVGRSTESEEDDQQSVF